MSAPTTRVGYRRMTTLRRIADEGWDVHGRTL